MASRSQRILIQRMMLFWSTRLSLLLLALIAPPLLVILAINTIFTMLQKRTRVEIWLYENADIRIQGRIIGFDEYSNLVLDDVEETNMKSGRVVKLGRIMQKGDTISVITPVIAS